MRKLIVFNNVSLDGYFVDSKGNMDWAHPDRTDPDWNAFVSGNASGNGTLVMGRVTYELMIRYWPTPRAKQHDPLVAEGMNRMPKVVFSRTLKETCWSNTRLVRDSLAGEIRRMKQESGEGMAILGSGSIVAQLTEEKLIDEYHFVVNPVILGAGRTMFEGVTQKMQLKLNRSRAFQNGYVVVQYETLA
jgi:dihydrofolate reductase